MIWLLVFFYDATLIFCNYFNISAITSEKISTMMF